MTVFRHCVALLLLLACAGMVAAQDAGLAPAGSDATAPAGQPTPVDTPAADPTAAGDTGLPPVDTAPAMDDSGAAPPDALPAEPVAVPEPDDGTREYYSAPGTEPVATEVTVPATAPAPDATGPTTDPAAAADADRTRSLLITVSGGVLVITLTLIVVLLVKRGREGRQQDRRYVAEAYLRDVSGSTSQSMIRLGSKPVMLGRVGGKDTEFLDYVVIPSATIGRRHALIEFKDFGYWIMDQGSINGTFVNNRPVSTEVRLKHGDRIRLHKLEFEFVMPEVSESSVTVLAPDAPRVAAAAAAAAAPAPAATDFVLELEPEAEPAADDMEALRESVESEEATLLPSGGSAPVRAAVDDETLLPATGGGDTGTDETLLPGTGQAGSGDQRPGKGERKKGDEFFDITGGD